MIDYFSRYYSKEMDELRSYYRMFINSQYYFSRGLDISNVLLIEGDRGVGKAQLFNLIEENSEINVIRYSASSSMQLQLNKEKKIKTLFIIDNIDGLNEMAINELKLFLINYDIRINPLLILIGTKNRYRISKCLIDTNCFNHVIKLNSLNKEEKYSYILSLIKDYKINLSEELSKKYIIPTIKDLRVDELKNLVNNLAVFYDSVSQNEMLDYINTYKDYYKTCNNPSREVAVHEAGHAIMHRHYSFSRVTALAIGDNSGLCHAETMDDNLFTYDRVIAKINCALAGIIATKLILRSGDVGCSNDLDAARSNAAFLVNRAGYLGEHLTLPANKESVREVTSRKQYNNEKKIENILKRQKRFVLRYLKKNKNELLRLSISLFENKHLNIKEIDEILK